MYLLFMNMFYSRTTGARRLTGRRAARLGGAQRVSSEEGSLALLVGLMIGWATMLGDSA